LKFVERFDHLPENDHCDKITAISGCSKLKLIATGSLDGTLRIWNGKNQLIRF
jgi:WD40 repeat protein